ncbi:VOC family protein [Pelagibacterium xiamenense]|uniref:VOC family protein n=1 Tax=Pelagibacterium xiamenense TaxID=2901140 RepID=UPI001E2F948E|nr:VOC family protein [Pelagibacterium xiamenense]MCD7059837.1 lactoylglutathione lyase [Pelagibacterium xiamenense]
MPKMIFVNLPVKDIDVSIRFYEAIGCTKNEQFSDENAASMVWSDTIVFMLLKHAYFSTFTTKQIADSHKTAEVLLALSCESREEVDTLVQAAGASGGTADVREPQDLGFMYSRAFADPDGHIFEPAYMNMEEVPAE